MIHWLKTLAFLGLMVGVGSAANAVTATSLPASSGSITCTNADGSSTADASSCTAAFASGLRTLSPDASLSGQASYPGALARVSGAVVGSTEYYFTVVGPSTTDAIPIDIDTVLHQSTVNGAYAFSEIIATAGTDLYHEPSSATETICSSFCMDQSPDFNGTLHISQELGMTSSVQLEIEAMAGFSAVFNSAEASVDSHIYVDPSFMNAAAYSIEFSPGVGNGVPSISPAPEPATWATMIAGFGSVGGVMRRKRKLSTGVSHA